MTPKERAAMQQALIYLDAIINGEGVKPYQLEGTAFTLREALAEQAEQEPVGHLCEASFGRGQVFWFNKPADNTPLYAAPVRTKDLTDVDLWNLWEKSDSNIEFARAVIAADREKNAV